MKLFFDENISFRILSRIDDLFPGSTQVSRLGIAGSADHTIWTYGRDNGFTIVTFDADFIDILMLKGFPPKIIWLRMGNSSTNEVANLLRRNHLLIKDFIENDTESACLELSGL